MLTYNCVICNKEIINPKCNQLVCNKKKCKADFHYFKYNGKAKDYKEVNLNKLGRRKHGIL